ncbi:outer membrane lipoprotein carrier protein LolA [Aquabacterium sp.]|uniref:outer membrane lipoprotein carrier protein LolA n=1 Tax=Aquabacterium sp. TaxID=1872578 RepID=UPI0035B03125
MILSDIAAWRRAGIALWLAALSQVSWAEAWGLPELMQSLAQTKSAKARFTEKKFIGFIDQPVEASGELAFVAPDHLEKRTLQPQTEVLVLDGERLTVEQAGKRRLTVDLRRQPDAAAFVESIRATLAGDQRALEQYYALDLQGSVNAWRLTLTPRQDGMRKIITRVRMEGRQATVSMIAFDQADGDRSEMRITRVAEP